MAANIEMFVLMKAKNACQKYFVGHAQKRTKLSTLVQRVFRLGNAQSSFLIGLILNFFPP